MAIGAAIKFDNKSGALGVSWMNAAISKAGFSVTTGAGTFGVSGEAKEEPFQDAAGRGGQVVRQTGGANGIIVRREVKNYQDGSIVISGEIENATAGDITINSVRMLDASTGDAGWKMGDDTAAAPAAVLIHGSSVLICEPPSKPPVNTERRYSGTQILAMGDPQGKLGLIVGFLSAQLARPDINAVFRGGKGGTYLVADQNFYGRKLRAGATLKLDAVYLAAGDNPYALLEEYGNTVAATSPAPVRKGTTALWCSWYAHRMAITEDLVLANAQVAAKHFEPLGFEIMQLDHGWQKGEITGNWEAKEQFPHGLKWLSEQLKSRFNLRLGLWIAPTDVAQTSDLYKAHPDWMLKDGSGKPLVNWKWYWKPNPNCYELDASNPAAAKWIEDTFARLTREGASYFKIDFIASSGGEQFFQSDLYATRGWSVLRSAMQAIRNGAGEEAWIRYCQPPPLLSVGLANSAYGGEDTYDAGVPQTINSLRDNGRSLAAGYWINDRLYHREVCDMSVRMQADEEEARLRLSVMALAGCSISFSDELQHLPPSRIRMMQQVLPPGAPAMKPVDLWERTIPSIWHLHCKNNSEQWETVGLFNWEDREEERTIEFARLGLAEDADVAAMEFWEQKFLGVNRKSLTLKLAPHTCRIVSLRKLTGVPQVVGTDMHVFQGFHELSDVAWDKSKNVLAGRCQRMAGVSGRVFLYVPDAYSAHFDFPLRDSSAHLTHVQGPIWAREIQFAEKTATWEIPFDRK